MDISGKAIARLEGIRLQMASEQALLGRKKDTLPEWLYEVEWRSQARFGRLEAPDFIPTPVEIASSLHSQVRELLVENGELHHHLQELLPELERMSLSFIVEGLANLGWSYKVGEYLDVAGVARRLGVVSQHERFVGSIAADSLGGRHTRIP